MANDTCVADKQALDESVATATKNRQAEHSEFQARSNGLKVDEGCRCFEQVHGLKSPALCGFVLFAESCMLLCYT